ncbi:hypothetical protein pb186bvf_017175 [Paramecium bursaria]
MLECQSQVDSMDIQEVHMDSFPYFPLWDSDNQNTTLSEQNHLPKQRNQKYWTPQEDKILKNLHKDLGNNWKQIAMEIDGRNASQCFQRFRRITKQYSVIIDFYLQFRKKWTIKEDELIHTLVNKLGRKWEQISKYFKYKHVCGKQIRLRYINTIDKTIRKDPWTKEEDLFILNFYLQEGSCWTKMSKLLCGRPENDVKNRFYNHIRHQYLKPEI